ncbi:MAG TPA: hypothetical protein V6D13_21225 [Halomicronema sp.]
MFTIKGILAYQGFAIKIRDYGAGIKINFINRAGGVGPVVVGDYTGKQN